MKYLILGAAGLLLSGTAMAGVPSSKAMNGASASIAAKDSDGLGESMIGNAITIDWPAKRADARAADRKHFADAATAPSEVPGAETPSTTAMSAADDDGLTGMGGPEEPIDGAMTASASAANYRACSPGPGDDNCIQLYERGVPEALASWEASRMGGERLAMGGPDEADEIALAEQGDRVAAYEPLPEDVVMPASDELAYTDAPTRGPNIPASL